MPLILGIDPGSRITGFGIINTNTPQPQCVAAGVIQLKQESFMERLHQIYRSICELITKYRPDEGVIEQVFFNQYPGAALKLGQARGAAIVAMASHGLVISEYSPREIKQAIVGHGAASKNQMQQMIERLLKLNTTPPTDAADALAIALCHSHSKKLAALIKKAAKKEGVRA